MPFSLELVQEADIWDALVCASPWNAFPQSWNWGVFQETRGAAIRRFVLKEQGVPLAVCQLLQYKRSFGMSYWVGVRGPVFLPVAKGREREIFHAFLTQLTGVDFPGYTLFFRFEPMLSADIGKNIMPIRMVRTSARSPAATRVLSLQKTEEELLKEMHSKTRYNIRVAQKHGVTVRVGDRAGDIEHFLDLTKETSERDAFTPHGDAYLRATYESLVASGMSRLRFAEKDGKILAANMEIVYGDTLTYLHGASSSHERQAMAPYLLHWEAIQAAKQAGLEHYDLWGCNPELTSSYYYKKSWEGISRFKQGWGGELVELIGTWDLPVNRLFYLLAFPKTIVR
jgi:peptidoglycan pentaglycine glycine transferase (the first glycine)